MEHGSDTSRVSGEQMCALSFWGFVYYTGIMKFNFNKSSFLHRYYFPRCVTLTINSPCYQTLGTQWKIASLPVKLRKINTWFKMSAKRKPISIGTWQTSMCEFKWLVNFILITAKTSQAQGWFSGVSGSANLCRMAAQWPSHFSTRIVHGVQEIAPCWECQRRAQSPADEITLLCIKTLSPNIKACAWY